jgi:hypothetical protein
MRRTLSAALTGLALVAIAQFSYAAADVASETQIAGLMGTGQSTLATAPAEARRAGRGSPFTLYVEDPNGNAFRLVRVEGGAWKYAEGWTSPDRAGNWLFRKTGFGSTTPAPAAKEAVPDEEPLSVFIDGPSGFMFVWNRDGGWKFVGKVADRGL